MSKKVLLELMHYWLTDSVRDWEAYLALRRARKFGHALFFLHLALEKKIKAAVVYQTKQQAPFTHNLVFLAGKLQGIEVTEALLEDLKVIAEFNMESRYPGEKSDFYARATKTFSDRWHKRGEDLLLWLDQALPR